MAIEPAPARPRQEDEALALARSWRVFDRVATAAAVISLPGAFLLAERSWGISVGWSVVLAILMVAAVRGLVDVVAHKLVPAASLYGSTDKELAAQDVVSRRRVWYWRKKYKQVIWIGGILLVVGYVVSLFQDESVGDALLSILDGIPNVLSSAPQLLATVGALFFINFLILFGPLVAMGAQQIKVYEPGDADWGVKLDDVRGQAEAKDEITKVVSLWQSGEQFVKAGGKRERGVLFLGAPGTGKTMLSKGIATAFNCPFVTIPGSGFAQTFIGMDAVLVRWLAFRARKQAAKWGGQCIVFIDEIDAVGMRRQALGGGRFAPGADFHGPLGAVNPGGDLVMESPEWREWQFQRRAPEPRGGLPAFYERLDGAIRRIIPGGMMGGGGGGMALNSLLVVMDGIDDPPWSKRFLTNRLNTFLDALYMIPRKVGPLRMRLRPPKPRGDEIYFIGATNVPIDNLDPALVRPGRMGRHVYFRTPTWEDRRDIFDLYLAKVAHEPELDTPEKLEELARITNGYSPAMIDQVCSMGLTYAHSDRRERCSWRDIVEAMTVVESGVAIGQPHAPHEERSIAVHEAGHAICSHLYADNHLSTRLSVRRRGDSGGHHAVMALEERFVSWRSEEVSGLVWGLGAMAAELEFYGQTTTGVGGDINGVTMAAARMVGVAAMAPSRVDLSDRIHDATEREAAEERIRERFQRIGNQLLHVSGSGSAVPQQYADVLRDGAKRRLVAELLGQAFVVASATVRANHDAVDEIASRLVAARELYGHEVIELLESVDLRKPEIDVLDEATWPAI